MKQVPQPRSLVRFAVRRILGYFLQGTLFLAPIGLTAYVASWSFINIDKGITELLPKEYQIPGLGVVVAAALITIIGYLSSKILFTFLFDNVEDLLERVPVVRVIYTSARDFMEAFLGKEKRFNQPVLIKMNKADDIERVGFITQTDLTELGIEGGKCAVYIPHSYNFSGNLFIVPVENVRLIEGVDASELMKFAVSGGVTKLKETEEEIMENERKEHSKLLRLFRLVAMAEGISFLLLVFIAMPIKWIPALGGNPMPVRYVGMAHGILFVLYVVLLIRCMVEYNWNIKKAAILFIASILPFGTFYADKKYLKPEEATIK